MFRDAKRLAVPPMFLFARCCHWQLNRVIANEYYGNMLQVNYKMVKQTCSENTLLMENLEKLHHNRAKVLTILQRLYECTKTDKSEQISSSAEFPVNKREARRKRTCTVPEPFKMTIREETTPIRALYAKRFTDELLENQRRQEAADRAKAHFRAGTVPPSTFLPLYEQMEVCRLDRRQFAAMHSKELVENIVKPFKFSEPSAPTLHQRRCRSAPACRNPGSSCASTFSTGKEIVEPRLYGEAHPDKSLKRSEEPFRAAKPLSTGPKRETQEVLKTQKTTLRHQRICAPPPLKFQPKIHREVPDFDVLQKKFQQKLNAVKLKNSQVVTVRPFYLRTSMVRSGTGSENAKGRQRNAQQSSKLTRSRSVPNFENYPAVDLTKTFNRTTRLRIKNAQQRRKDLESRAQCPFNHEHEAMLAELKDQVQRLVAEERIKRSLTEMEKRKQLKTTSAVLKNWYSEKLLDLKKRVLSGPTLLERQKTLIAKQSLESRFKEILKEAGVDQSLFSTATVWGSDSSRDSNKPLEWQSHSGDQSLE
ncbi:ABC1 family protein [Trichuris trichiura]|uniref:ABC1 family protein n=1 Tax=Trichuris trichiura TaxID=36087 RepID=A0A077YZT3_TRITR|nr:ABC1 family protein [Trichuris trichiura]